MTPVPAGALEARLAAGGFVVTAELTPPLSASAQALLAAAAPLRDRVDAVNVTDAAGARVAMSSFAAAAMLRGAGIEPVLQLTCRDRNRIALAGDLIGAAAQGVRNILVLHGDDPATGDLPDAKAVYDLDSRGVMRLARRMGEDGVLPSGRAIRPPPRFFIGAADSPFDPSSHWRPEALMAKADAGAGFVQTQFCFDAGMARRYMARLAEAGLTERLAVLIGVGPLASARSARWMNESLFGVAVPDSVVERLERANDPAAEGRRLCIDLIHELREIPGVCGVHIMAPLQGAEAIAEVVDGAGLRARPRRARTQASP
ncbi:MAG: methylenetetrahydrofolate reductase [Kiloniellaceae bacterium]